MAFNSRSVPRNATDKMSPARFPGPSATMRLKESREGTPRILGRQKVPRDRRLRKYLLICGPSKLAAQARSAWGPRDRIKALHGPRTQAYGETNYSDGESPRLKYCRMLRPIRVLGWWWGAPLFSSLRGLFIWRMICPRMVISRTASSLRFSPRLVRGKYYFSRVALIVPSTSIRVMAISFYYQVFWS